MKPKNVLGACFELLTLLGEVGMCVLQKAPLVLGLALAVLVSPVVSPGAQAQAGLVLGEVVEVQGDSVLVRLARSSDGRVWPPIGAKAQIFSSRQKGLSIAEGVLASVNGDTGQVDIQSAHGQEEITVGCKVEILFPESSRHFLEKGSPSAPAPRAAGVMAAGQERQTGSSDAADAAGPGATSHLRLVGGQIAGQSVSTQSAVIRVAPGTKLDGFLEFEIRSTFASNAVMAMGLTPTWGDHRTSFVDLGRFSTPATALRRKTAVRFAAPAEPGTYFIIAAFNGEFTAEQVMSCTNWSAGAVRWDDANDVADWSPAMVEEAKARGTVAVDYWFPQGAKRTYMPAAAVTVVVAGNVTGRSSRLASSSAGAGDCPSSYFMATATSLVASKLAQVEYAPITRAAVEGVSVVRYIYGAAEFIFLGAPSLTLSIANGGPLGLAEHVGWTVIEEMIKEAFHDPEKASRKIAKAAYDMGLGAYRENYGIYHRYKESGSISDEDARRFVVNWHLQTYMTAAKRLYNDTTEYEKKDQVENPEELLLQQAEEMATGSARQAFGSLGEMQVDVLLQSTGLEFAAMDSTVKATVGLAVYPPYRAFLESSRMIDQDLGKALAGCTGAQKASENTNRESPTPPPLDPGYYIKYFHGEKAGMGEHHDWLATELRKESALRARRVACVSKLAANSVVPRCKGAYVVVGPFLNRMEAQQAQRAVEQEDAGRTQSQYLHTYGDIVRIDASNEAGENPD